MTVDPCDCGERRVGSIGPSRSQTGGKNLGLWYDQNIKNRVWGLPFQKSNDPDTATRVFR